MSLYYLLVSMVSEKSAINNPVVPRTPCWGCGLSHHTLHLNENCSFRPPELLLALAELLLTPTATFTDSLRKHGFSRSSPSQVNPLWQ